MNVSQFCLEHKIPHQMGYEASFMLKDRRDFEEQEMIDVIVPLMQKKIEYHENIAARLKKYIKLATDPEAK